MIIQASVDCTHEHPWHVSCVYIIYLKRTSWELVIVRSFIVPKRSRQLISSPKKCNQHAGRYCLRDKKHISNKRDEATLERLQGK